MDRSYAYGILFLIIIPMVMSLVVGTDANPGGLVYKIRTLSMMTAYYLLRGYTQDQDSSQTAVCSRSMIQDSMNNQSLNQSTDTALIHADAVDDQYIDGHWIPVNLRTRSRMGRVMPLESMQTGGKDQSIRE